MSAPESRFVEDIKVSHPPLNTNKDVEQGAPPSYPLDETEELVVGGPKPRCKSWKWFGRNRRCSRHSEGGEGRKKRSKLFRAVKFLFVGWLLLSAVHIVSTGFKLRKAYKTIKCTAVTPSNASDGLDFTLPLAHDWSRFVVHDSLSGGDTLITHDSNVANGTVQLSVKFADGTEQDAVYDGCMVKWKRGTAVGLIPRKCHGARAQVASLSLRFPTSVTAPSVHFLGQGGKHLSDRKLRKMIRWWRKHQEKKGLIEGDN